ncbi:hypothetical protein B0H67DRAFT_644671 [Lasiosphaeris hirsuta]|uniref:FAD/NAD(P)-binding domain-containing protein n=1 Tax=Lasiosphaeris hirsuta TaxID=260670 RepID=A0AA40AFE4_9PEZI|nr:hypothetical protein B0H67DRAFT_644671 [Lasiosphaeris hirsuta]
MAKTVVILGGSYAGLHVAHALLKKNDKDLKVILVAQNSHFYWNMASIRAILPEVLKPEDLFKPLETILKKYPETAYELVVGSATATDFEGKSVRVVTASGERSIAYDQLVLATGARTPTSDVPWKAPGTYEEVTALLASTADKIKAASHIVIAGGGSTGVELAGELGYEYGKTKEIILINATDKLLGGDSVANAAANELKKLKVTVKYGARADAANPSAADPSKIDVVLSNGETITTDLYLPTTGLVPNSEYVDAKYLNANKTIKVTDTLLVEGTTNVWAAGDVVSKPRAGFMIAQKQAAAVAKNIELTNAGKPALVAKGMPVDVLFAAVGRGRGVGRAGPVKFPSFLVWLAKGKQLGLNMIGGYVDGSVA